MKYKLEIVGCLYVVIDTTTGKRITFFGVPMAPVSYGAAIELLEHMEKYGN